jgi:hypothetical protein
MTMFTLSLTFFTVKKFFSEFANAAICNPSWRAVAHARGGDAAGVDP